MIVSIPSAVIESIDGTPITVEVSCDTAGLPGFNIIGMPDTAIRESKDRVRAAITSSGFEFPQKKYTVSLVPSEVRKHGAGLDLPIALGILVATLQLPLSLIERCGAVGELGLDGCLRAVPGMVSLAEAIDAPRLLFPREGSSEAALVRPEGVFVAGSLRELVEDLRTGMLSPATTVDAALDEGRVIPDLADVRGQPFARKALEIAAAGGHHLLMVGPPGSGKSMLASRLAGLLPPLAPEDAVAVTRIHSVSGLREPGDGLLVRPPYRAPHHGASAVAMVGGGSSFLRPGEISAAHCGVLFMDELAEFPRVVIDALRQPLEDGVIVVSRASGSATLPARFQLVGAMNPCPCGRSGPTRMCDCSPAQRQRYRQRVSGPIMDRFDLRIEVEPPDPTYLIGPSSEEGTDAVAERVERVRDLARRRGLRSNAEITADQIDDIAPLSDEASSILVQALRDGHITGRGLRRIRTVARTIADLEDTGHVIEPPTVHMAMMMRARSFQHDGAAA